jgi:hypothetical protein
MGGRDPGAAAVMAEQGTQSGGCHARAAGRSFQRDEQRWAALLGPFQAQIVIQ